MRFARIRFAGAIHAHAGLEPFAAIDRRIDRSSIGEHSHVRVCGRRFGIVACDGRIVARLRSADRLDRDLLDDDRLARQRKAVALAMRLRKFGLHGGERRIGNRQRGIRPLVFEMQTALDLDLVARHVLAAQLGQTFGGERVEIGGDAGEQAFFEAPFDRAFAQHAKVGQAHAVGRQHARKRMHEHGAHAERVGHFAGVLAAGPAEAVQRVALHVVTALDRYLLDGIRHVLDSDLEEAFGDFFRRRGLARRGRDAGGKGREFFAHNVGIERLVAGGAEQLREKRGHDLADHDVGVGDREWPAAAIASGARIGAGTVGADAKARPVEMQDRAAAGRNRVDLHHGGAHAHARHDRLEGALKGAVVEGDVGGRSAHVEADDLVEPGRSTRGRRAHNAARRTRQDRIFALEQPRIDKPAVRLHEQKPRFAKGSRHAVHIAAQDRRHVGVHHGRVAAPDEFHQGRHGVARRDLGKADAPRDRGHSLFVRGETIAVHQHDRERANAVVVGFLQCGFGRRCVERLHNRAIGGDALDDLEAVFVEQFGQFDLAHKKPGPILVGNAQLVGEARRDRERHACTLALQERIGRNRGAHLDRVDGLAFETGIGR